MKKITCYFDFISPYAYLAFEALPSYLQDLSYIVNYKPVLFAAMLKHHGQLGPAEIPGKREWTYRQVLWHAHQQQIPMQMPQTHPFNPLAYLRLAIACGQAGQPNRHVCETIFKHIWVGGHSADDAQRLQALMTQLAPAQAIDAPEVKAQLQAHTQEALARGVFGVPSFEVDGHVFWGFDALPLLRAYLQGDDWFEHAWVSAGQVGEGVKR